MGKRGGSKIDARAARAIATKLKAEIKAGNKHDIASVSFSGTLVATFGIRRGSNTGHPYIPQQIFVSEHMAVKLASCSMSYEEYEAEIRSKGKFESQQNAC